MFFFQIFNIPRSPTWKYPPKLERTLSSCLGQLVGCWSRNICRLQKSKSKIIPKIYMFSSKFRRIKRNPGILVFWHLHIKNYQNEFLKYMCFPQNFR
jgi:hypothetical protein